MRTTSYLIITFLLLTLIHQTFASEDIFLIESVPIDISSESATMAREQAIVDARRKAWDFFVARVVSVEDRSKVGDIKDQDLVGFVESLSVNSAKNSSTRYIGDFKIGFHKGRVDQFFQNKGISYTKNKGPKLLVVPILKNGKKSVLWEESNQWLQAWKNFKHPNGLIDVVIPLGDLEDENFVNATKAIQIDPKALLGLIRHYQVADVMLVIAEPEGDSLKMTAHICPLSQTSEKIEMTTENPEGQNLWAQGVIRIMDTIEDTWRQKYLKTPLKPKTDELKVDISSPQDLERVIQDLKRFPAIRDVKIESISCKEGVFSITHFLSEDAVKSVQLSLAQVS